MHLHFLVSNEYEAGKPPSKAWGGFVWEQDPSEPRVGKWVDFCLAKNRRATGDL